MKKNLGLIIVIFILITSCGKKNDPVYKGQNFKILDTKLIRVLWNTYQITFQLMGLKLIF